MLLQITSLRILPVLFVFAAYAWNVAIPVNLDVPLTTRSLPTVTVSSSPPIWRDADSEVILSVSTLILILPACKFETVPIPLTSNLSKSRDVPCPTPISELVALKLVAVSTPEVILVISFVCAGVLETILPTFKVVISAVFVTSRVLVVVIPLENICLDVKNPTVAIPPRLKSLVNRPPVESATETAPAPTWSETLTPPPFVKLIYPVDWSIVTTESEYIVPPVNAAAVTFFAVNPWSVNVDTPATVAPLPTTTSLIVAMPTMLIWVGKTAVSSVPDATLLALILVIDWPGH